jgi:peptidoglycan-N-acetylglucosamine deacetylase
MSFSARLVRKLSIAGIPLPGLLHKPHHNGTDIFLTFDDGPNPETTPRVLEILNTHNARATFFVCGQNAVQHPQLTARLVAAGHGLANHTFSHPKLTEIPFAQALEEVERCQQVLAPYSAPRLFRPTYGMIGPRLLMALARRNYRIAFWTKNCADHLSSTQEDSEALKLASTVKAGDILLFHDDQANSIRILKLFLEEIKDRKFRFVGLGNSGASSRGVLHS